MIINKYICFIHIPKAGGSTIENLLLDYETNYFYYILLKIREFLYDIIKKYASLLCSLFMNYNLQLLRTINDWFLNSYHETYLSKHKKDNSCNTNKQITYFSCVRHPQARLVSLYTFLQPKMTFDKFVIDLLSNKCIYPPKLSYQEQSLFLCDENNKIIVPYLKIENIKKDWKKICKIINILYKENKNSSDSDDSSDSSDSNDIPCKNKSYPMNNNLLHWKNYYDTYPHLVDIVKNYYKNDFINFNYDIYYPIKNLNQIVVNKNENIKEK
jgi:hypothetical protein